jgi:Fic family protein
MSTTQRTALQPVSYEVLPWAGRLTDGMASRTKLRRHRGPYSAAVPAEVAGVDTVLQAQTLAMAAEAAAEVARFDAELGGEIAPFASILLRSESAASSQIENLTASARAISEAELTMRGSGNAGQVVGNVAAMSAAVALSEALTGDAILGMHKALLSQVDPEIAGRWRSQPVWIGGSSLGPHAAAFVPPRHERVPRLIDDLVAYIDRDDVPVLVQAAVAHAQFETIHPFPDGNGRTGRALMHAMLRGKRLTRNVTVPISAGLLVDVDAYFAALTAFRQGEADPIVERVADAAFAAVANGRHLVADLREVRRSWDSRIKVRRGATTWRVVDLLLRQPVVNAALLSRELGIAQPNVYRTLEPLEAAEVLVASGGSSRGRIWRSPEVLDAVEAFAERAGARRQPTA